MTKKILLLIFFYWKFTIGLTFLTGNLQFDVSFCMLNFKGCFFSLKEVILTLNRIYLSDFVHKSSPFDRHSSTFFS